MASRRAFVVPVVLVAALCGCGQGQPAPAPEAPAAAPAPEAAGEPPAAEPVAETPAPATPGFQRSLSLQGISFEIVQQADQLVITPGGLEISNEPMIADGRGQVMDAEVGDLNADGSPEVYVYLQEGEQARGRLVAYAANNGKSLSEIYLPPITDDAALAAGYAGGDQFTLIENWLGRRFPLVGDDGQPTGQLRQITYRLEPGEAGWKLTVDQVNTF